jgi:hypothetical protein
LKSAVSDEEGDQGEEAEFVAVEQPRDVDINFGEPSPRDDRDKEEQLQEVAEALGEWERQQPSPHLVEAPGTNWGCDCE